MTYKLLELDCNIKYVMLSVFKVNNKDTRSVPIDVILLSLSLSLNTLEHQNANPVFLLQTVINYVSVLLSLHIPLIWKVLSVFYQSSML